VDCRAVGNRRVCIADLAGTPSSASQASGTCFAHHTRNLVLAGLAALTTVAIEAPLIQPLARLVEERNWGMIGTFRLHGIVAAACALVLMDYTFYVWHVLLHRAPLLWRFHAVHHVDLDLDTSTALRFHFGELLLSIPWRATQVLVIGLSPLTFSLWQVWFTLCVMFHHSNVRLPIRWERRINRILVTPRMHGVHHSNIAAETNSNWSSGLTVWDWLHGTLRLNIPQEKIEIGVPAFQDARVVVLPAIPGNAVPAAAGLLALSGWTKERQTVGRSESER